MQLGQKQRYCQVASQPEYRKSSRKLDKVAYRCPEKMQKRVEERDKWLRQGEQNGWSMTYHARRERKSQM